MSINDTMTMKHSGPDAENIDDDCAVLIADLKQEFAQDLKERLPKLENLVTQRRRWFTGSTTAVGNESHRLRGTAAAFGWPVDRRVNGRDRRSVTAKQFNNL